MFNHIEIKYHYIMDMVHRGAVRLQYVTTQEQVVNVLTKPLSRMKFEHFRESLAWSLFRGSDEVHMHCGVVDILGTCCIYLRATHRSWMHWL
jgi:hypothetical protein